MAPKRRPDLSLLPARAPPGDDQPRPSFSAASFVPSTRLVIFCHAVSRAKSGDPWLGFSSMLNGENPQSSGDPSRYPGVQRVDHADIGHLRHAVGVGPQMLPDELVDPVLVPLASQLDQEVPSVD